MNRLFQYCLSSIVIFFLFKEHPYISSAYSSEWHTLTYFYSIMDEQNPVEFIIPEFDGTSTNTLSPASLSNRYCLSESIKLHYHKEHRARHASVSFQHFSLLFPVWQLTFFSVSSTSKRSWVQWLQSTLLLQTESTLSAVGVVWWASTIISPLVTKVINNYWLLLC